MHILARCCMLPHPVPLLAQVKETLHLGRHSSEQKHQPSVHTGASGGDVHVARQQKTPSEPIMGSADAAGHVEKDRGYPAGISAAPAKSMHEPIAPAKGVTSGSPCPRLALLMPLGVCMTSPYTHRNVHH